MRSFLEGQAIEQGLQALSRGRGEQRCDLVGPGDSLLVHVRQARVVGSRHGRQVRQHAFEISTGKRTCPKVGRIAINSEATLSGIPAEARSYCLGKRSAVDWVLDQHKEKKPKEPTIREKFDTHRFADHKERAVDLLGRVARVSVDTVRIVNALAQLPR